MREIKFRAWREGRMIYSNVPSGILIRLDGGLTKLLASTHYEIEDKDLVIMQYTGFKDTNGKEIYEGDFVRGCDEDGIPFVGVIEWENAGFSINEDGAYMVISCMHPLAIESLEVYGNIFEEESE